MKKLKIFTLLSSIQTIELKRYIRYIKSDSVFESRDYLPLAEHLLKFYPDFNSKLLTLGSMYNSLYPEKIFNKRVIISRLSELNRITENFLLSIRINKNSALRDKLLAEELMHRKIYESFEHLIDKLIKKEKYNSKISEKQLYDLDWMMMIKGEYLTNREKFPEIHELLGENITVFFNYLVIRLLTMYCAMRSIGNFQVTGTSAKILDSFMRQINFENIIKSNSDSRLAGYMNVMLHIYKLYGKKSNDKEYYKAKMAFLENIHSYEQNTKFTIFSLLYSYVILQKNKGRYDFVKEIYDLLKLIIKYNGYLRTGNEYIPNMLYREYIFSALKQKDVKGAEKFIENYTENLAPEYRETVKQYSIGKIKMHLKDFTAVLKIYDSCPSNLPILNLDIRIDKLVALYELGHIYEFINELNKNKSILKSNKKITAYQYSSFKIYNTLMEKLVKLKLKPDTAAKNKLLTETGKLKIMHYKDWIIKQINLI